MYICCQPFVNKCRTFIDLQSVSIFTVQSEKRAREAIVPNDAVNAIEWLEKEAERLLAECAAKGRDPRYEELIKREALYDQAVFLLRKLAHIINANSSLRPSQQKFVFDYVCTNLCWGYGDWSAGRNDRVVEIATYINTCWN